MFCKQSQRGFRFPLKDVCADSEISRHPEQWECKSRKWCAVHAQHLEESSGSKKDLVMSDISKFS